MVCTLAPRYDLDSLHETLPERVGCELLDVVDRGNLGGEEEGRSFGNGIAAGHNEVAGHHYRIDLLGT